jgi:predicted tellurium resistance membrane protein TerC
LAAGASAEAAEVIILERSAEIPRAHPLAPEAPGLAFFPSEGLAMWVAEWVVPLVTLTAMEIVLGIDNIVFIAIIAGRLPPERQEAARRLGLAMALVTRLLLLLALSWVLGLTRPVFKLSDLGVPADWLTPATNEISWRDILLIGGGVFLIGKSTYEIHESLEGAGGPVATGKASGMGWVVAQIAVLDIVFSLDSVITAVGMARQLWVMAAAMVIAVGVMLVFAGRVSDFVHRHPTLKMLALSFLILIGVMLVAEGIEKHIERGYIYFAMLFALAVELLNLRVRKQHAGAPDERRAVPSESPLPGPGGAGSRRLLR